MDPLERRWDFDWLRSLAILLLIPLHTARVFDPYVDNYVIDKQTSPVMREIFIDILVPWLMPLLFFLAGSAAYLSIARRGLGGFVKERVWRLLVPFIFGVLVVIPPMAYLGWLTHGGERISYLAYLGRYFGNFTGDLSGYTGLITPGHLWFVIYLFAMSLVFLPLLRLRRNKESQAAHRFAQFVNLPGGLFLLAVPPALLLLVPFPLGRSYNILYFAAFFLFGFLLSDDDELERALDRHRYPALALGILSMVVYRLLANLGPGWEQWSLGGVGFIFLDAFNTWFWLVALVAFGRRLLSFPNRWLRYFSKASYPFFIIHQTVIVAIGYFVVRWNMGPWPKFFIIAALSLAACLGMYDLLIKRTIVTRFLFGVKGWAPRSRVPRSL
jgi:glucan biosynthesis protein C